MIRLDDEPFVRGRASASNVMGLWCVSGGTDPVSPYCSIIYDAEISIYTSALLVTPIPIDLGKRPIPATLARDSQSATSVRFSQERHSGPASDLRQ